MNALKYLLRRLRALLAHEREIIGEWSFRPADNDNLSPRARAFRSDHRKAS